MPRRYRRVRPYRRRNGTRVRSHVRRERVTRIIDGDTFMTASRIKPVRLAGYNAPEKGQRGYASRTHALRRLIKGEKVEIHTITRDVYGRSVAKVIFKGKSINRELKRKFKV